MDHDIYDNIDLRLVKKHAKYTHDKKMKEYTEENKMRSNRYNQVDRTLIHLLKPDIQKDIENNLIKHGQYTYDLTDDIQFDTIHELLEHPTYIKFKEHWRKIAVYTDFDIAITYYDEMEMMSGDKLLDPYLDNTSVHEPIAKHITFVLDTNLNLFRDNKTDKPEKALHLNVLGHSFRLPDFIQKRFNNDNPLKL